MFITRELMSVGRDRRSSPFVARAFSPKSNDSLKKLQPEQPHLRVKSLSWRQIAIAPHYLDQKARQM